MPASADILELVRRFDEHLSALFSYHYKEAQLRQDFIDPMFSALGWDVENKQEFTGAARDVIGKDSVVFTGITKAPDYCFCTDGAPKFFVETKQPYADIKHGIRPAYQLRRYGWSAKLPLSIFTDFEEFAVYDCRVRPRKSDKASIARVMYLTYDQYIDRWDDISSLFSREAVTAGSLNKYVESIKQKRRIVEVEDALLVEIVKWWDRLSRSITRRNPPLAKHELNAAIQCIINQMIIFRIFEDRKIEHYGQLRRLLKGDNVYVRLYELFRKADESYNLSAVCFPAELGQGEQFEKGITGLNIDDTLLKDIIRKLYYPDSPFEFSVIPADALEMITSRPGIET